MTGTFVAVFGGKRFTLGPVADDPAPALRGGLTVADGPEFAPTSGS